MTNEEAVKRIQEGDDSCIPALWEGVKKFVRLFAYKYQLNHERLCKRAGMELEDLYQCGYFAVIKAIKGFKAQKSTKFLSYLGFYLHNEFNGAVGLRVSASRNDACFHAISLDTVLTDADDLTIGESIEDTRAAKDFDAVIENIYSQEARRNLMPAIKRLTPEEQETIYRFFYSGEGITQIANTTGRKRREVESCYHSAIVKLRRSKEVQQYREEYLLAWAYKGSGLSIFKHTRKSSVERTVLRLEELDERERWRRDG